MGPVLRTTQPLTTMSPLIVTAPHALASSLILGSNEAQRSIFHRLSGITHTRVGLGFVSQTCPCSCSRGASAILWVAAAVPLYEAALAESGSQADSHGGGGDRVFQVCLPDHKCLSTTPSIDTHASICTVLHDMFIPSQYTPLSPMYIPPAQSILMREP